MDTHVYPTPPPCGPTPPLYPYPGLDPYGFQHLPKAAVVAGSLELQPNYWLMLKAVLTVEEYDPGTKKVLVQLSPDETY